MTIPGTDYYLYRYMHKETKKIYVGMTNDINRRIKAHTRGHSGARAFNGAVKKHGIDAFDFLILAKYCSVDEAAEMEQVAINTLGALAPSGYNLKAGAPFTRYSGPQTIETRARISASRCVSPKAQKAISELNARPEHKKQLAELASSPEHRNRLDKLNDSIKHQEHMVRLNASSEHKEQLDKFHESLKGIPLSKEHREKLSNAKKGIKRTPMSAETRNKISAAKKGKMGHLHSEETRRKMSSSAKAIWEKRKECKNDYTRM
jgi:group I intron endonuclease